MTVLWFESGIGNDVLEQSEESKLQCVIKTSADPSDLNGVSSYVGPASHTHTPFLPAAGTSLHLDHIIKLVLLPVLI